MNLKRSDNEYRPIEVMTWTDTAAFTGLLLALTFACGLATGLFVAAMWGVK